MQVLLVEDERAMSQSIELMLKSEGFNVYTTDLGEEGGRSRQDLRLRPDPARPQPAGHERREVLRTLRVGKVNTPIMILSGISGIDTKVKTVWAAAPTTT
jgi:two-component system cell cycle response regulator CtrA